jgi:hypothetical protein
MKVLKTPDSGRTERSERRRLEIARGLYRALVAEDPDRVIILRDGGGRVVARHDLRPEQGDPETPGRRNTINDARLLWPLA